MHTHLKGASSEALDSKASQLGVLMELVDQWRRILVMHETKDACKCARALCIGN
jgi:hypothetical protein